VLNAEGEVLSKDFPGEYTIEGIAEIADSIDMVSLGLYKHHFIDTLGHKTKVHSAYSSHLLLLVIGTIR
jgi:hypothetical protein